MTPARPLRWRLPCLVFCTAALAGWWQADRPGNPDVADSSAVPTRSPRPPRPPRHASHKAEPEQVRRLLAPVRAARTPEDRQRAAIHLALTLPVAELAAWFDAEWYPFRDGIDSNVFYRITRQRWQEEDPAGYLNRALVKKPDDTHEAAGLWAKRDPEAALAWLHALTDPRDFTAMADSVCRSLATARPALALAEIVTLRGRLPNAESTLQGMLAALAGNSAAALRQAATTWPAELREMAGQALAGDLLKRDFAAGLADLQGREDGRKVFLKALNGDRELAAKLVDSAGSLPEGWLAAAIRQSGGWALVHQNPERWMQVDLAALGLDEATAANFRQTTLNSLANKDPAAAFAALDTVEMSQSDRQNLWESAFRSLAYRNPADAQAMLAQLSDPATIARCEQVLESLKSGGPKPKVPPTPTAWVTNLGQANDGENPSDPFGYESQATWDRSAIQEARTAFAQMSAEQKARAAGQLAAGQGASEEMPELRADAFRWLLENPPAGTDPSATADRETGLIRNASRLATEWAGDDPQAASRWAQSLPTGDTRLWAMKNLAREWAEYEPTAATAWANTLPAAEQAEITAYLKAENADSGR
jgi:hypothetical protein